VSWSVNIFVGTSVSLEDVAAEVKSILGMDLTRTHKDAEETYELAAPNYILALGRHDLVNNKGIPFEECPIQIGFWATDVPDWDTSRRECLRVARSIFEVLKVRGRYRLLLVRNVQELLEDYSPPGV